MNLEVLFNHIKKQDSLEIFSKALNMYLLCENHTINDVDQEGDTLLIRAISADRLDIVKLLVLNRANINTPKKDGTTALMYAIECENDKITNFLLEQEDIILEAYDDIYPTTLLERALLLIPYFVWRPIAQNLIKKGADVRSALNYFRDYHHFIYFSLKEADRFLPPFFDKEWSEEVTQHNNEITERATLGGLIVGASALDQHVSNIVRNYLSADPHLIGLFDQAFQLARPAPIILSASLSSIVKTREKLVQEQSAELARQRPLASIK